MLKPSVEEMNYLWENIADNETARHHNDNLKKEWTIVNQCYIERYNRYAKCNEKLNELRNACWNFDDKLLKMEAVVKDLTNSQTKVNKAKIIEIDHEIPRMPRMMNNINAILADVTSRSSDADVKEWQSLINTLNTRSDKLAAEWNIQKSRYVFFQFIILKLLSRL